MGECAGSAQFTHVAYDDFRVVRDNLAGRKRTTRDRVIPYCVFIDPELGRIGLNEMQAKLKGIDVRVVTLPIASILRARTLGKTRGFMKVLLEDRRLGVARGWLTGDVKRSLHTTGDANIESETSTTTRFRC